MTLYVLSYILDRNKNYKNAQLYGDKGYISNLLSLYLQEINNLYLVTLVRQNIKNRLIEEDKINLKSSNIIRKCILYLKHL